MVYAATVNLKDAKRTLDYLRANDLLDTRYQFKKTKTTIAFPSKKSFKKTGVVVEEVDKDFFAQTRRSRTLRDVLQNVLTADQLEHLKTAYDLVGSIAILEIDDQLRAHEREIAAALLETNPAIKTVLRKDGAHEGEFRTQKMKFLAGEDTRITTHIESGVRMRIDVENVYFSPRLSTERLRILQQVRPGEDIMTFFSGAAPYPLLLAKKTEAHLIVGIEINPVGHELGEESVRLNKLKNVRLFCGDVHKLAPKVFAGSLAGTQLPLAYDRIIMNLPKTAHEFLDDALSLAKPGAIIHYYDFLHEEQFDVAVQRVKAACKRNNKSCELLGIFTCGAQGVRTYRICVDVKVA